MMSGPSTLMRGTLKGGKGILETRSSDDIERKKDLGKAMVPSSRA
jgi:hypothetical protein